MNGTAKYFFCLPEKVYGVIPELEALGGDEVHGFNRSYLLELLTLISLHQRKGEGQARLKATYLHRIIPNYQGYIKFLIDLGIIRRSGKYIPGELSYSYSFTPEYTSRLVYRPVTDQVLIRRLYKTHLRRHNSRKIPVQTRYLKAITIDSVALEFIEDLEDNKHDAALASILKIQHRDIFCSIDTTSGRFHSNLTNLPELLRQFIRIEGKQLSNVDIKNSQPYLSTLLLTNPGKVARFAKSKHLSMLLKTLEAIETMDVKMFVYLTVKGKLYEFLVEKGIGKDRRDAKKQLFVIMFGPGSYWSRSHEIFESWFPSVYERFTIIKGHTRGSKFENYKRMAILLQTVESFLVLDTILPRIFSEHPGTIAVTIHDSVMTSILTNDQQAVADIMNDELTKFVGYKPALKVDFSTKNYIPGVGKDEDRNTGIQYHYGTTNPVMN